MGYPVGGLPGDIVIFNIHTVSGLDHPFQESRAYERPLLLAQKVVHEIVGERQAMRPPAGSVLGEPSPLRLPGVGPVLEPDDVQQNIPNVHSRVPVPGERIRERIGMEGLGGGIEPRTPCLPGGKPILIRELVEVENERFGGNGRTMLFRLAGQPLEYVAEALAPEPRFQLSFRGVVEPETGGAYRSSPVARYGG